MARSASEYSEKSHIQQLKNNVFHLISSSCSPYNLKSDMHYFSLNLERQKYLAFQAPKCSTSYLF